MTKRIYISFAEVREKITLPQVLDVLGIRDQFREKPGKISGVCPIPTHDHGPSPNDQQFQADNKKGHWLFHCFGCGAAGDVVSFVKAYRELSDAHVRFFFAEHFGDVIEIKGTKPQDSRQKSPKKETSDDPGRNAPPVYSIGKSIVLTEPPRIKQLSFRLNLNPGAPYLAERGITEDTAQRFDCGLCSRGMFSGLICFPLYDHRNGADANPVSYIGRVPSDEDDGNPRWRMKEGFEKSHVLFGLPESLRDSPGNHPLVVTEGVFDALAVYQAGFVSVATLGSSLSDEQAWLLKVTRRPIVVMFDGDQSGRDGARAATAKLLPHTFVRVVDLPPDTDPGGLTKEALTELLTFYPE